MERNILKSENGKQELEIILIDEEFQSYFKKAFNNIKNQIKMPGFRKGKVPYHIAKKQYGAEIESDAVEIAVSEEFHKIVEQDNIKIISQPTVKDVIKKNGAVKFKIQYETYPEFELKEFKGMQIEEPIHVVTNDEVQQEIQKILNAQGTFETVETIEDENHVASVKIIEIDPETKEPIEGSEPQEQNYYLSDSKIDRNLVEVLIGHKSSEKVEYTFDDNASKEGEESENETHTFEVEIGQVQKVVPKELSDDFVKEYTKEKFDNIDDFREEIEMKLQSQWDQGTRQAIENQIITKLVNDNYIVAPDSFKENAINQMMQNFKQQFGAMPQFQGADDSIIRAEFEPMAERNVKWELIRNQIAEKEEIIVEDFDIEQLANQEATKSGQPVNQIKQIIQNNEQIKTSILNKKVIDYVLDFAITKEVEYDELDD